MANPVLLDGLHYTVAVREDGSPRIVRSSRPSQPADAGGLTFAEWRTDGHDFNSFEDISSGASAGYLGRDWGENTDGRNLGVDTLGPLVNVVDLSTYDNPLQGGLLGGGAQSASLILGGGATAGSGGLGPSEIVADSNGFASIVTSSDTYGYVNRGTRPAKVALSDMTLKESGLTLTNPGTSIIATSPALQTVRNEVSIAQGTSPYVVLQQGNVGIPPATDTWLTNSANEDATVFGQAPDRVVLLHENNVKGNIQTGSVTMAAPNWLTVTDEMPYGVLPTGFAMDGNLWVIGTSDGPYMLDSLTRKFFPIMSELDNDDANCVNTGEWFAVGVIIPLAYSLRYQKYGSGASFGPETFPINTSPVQGTPTAVAGSPRELFTVEQNPDTGDAYLIAWYPREAGDRHSGILSPYTIAKFDSTDSDYLAWVGTVNGLRVNPTLMGGYGSDSFYITTGRTSRWIDDSNYRYTPTGTTYLTEMRRLRNVIADIEFVEFEAGGTLSPTQTITVALSMDGGAYTAIGASQTTTGFKRLLAASGGIPTDTFHGIHKIKPSITYVTDDSSEAPQVVGPLRVYYRTRPTEIVVQQITFVLGDQGSTTAKGQEDSLRGLIYDGPVEYQDTYSDTYYVRVTSVGEVKIVSKGQGRDSERGFQAEVVVELETWTVTQ